MNFHGEFALKMALQVAKQYALPELIALAQRAHADGFKQIWVNDNLCQRNVLIVLTAIAARVPIKLGTSILVPYFRNPVDVADSLATLSELMDGRELSVGIARGEAAIAGQQVDMPKPLAMVRETTLALKALLGGNTVFFRHFPVCAAYHHIHPQQQFRLAFTPAAPIRFYSGGNAPQILRIAGEIMDGALIGDHYIPLVRSGRLDRLLTLERSSAAEKQPGKSLFDICELDIAIARDRARAFEFAKPMVANILMGLDGAGYSDDEIRVLGVEPRLIKSLQEARVAGATVQAVSVLIPDDAVKSCFVAGGPEECRDQLAPLLAEAVRLQLGQVAFAKLGPDYDEAITLLRRQLDIL